MTIEVVVWVLMAAVAVACALGMIVTNNPVHSALYLVCTLVSLGVIYLILSAPVLFAIQLIVYAGAIMILFLFVIMFFMAPSALKWLRPSLKGQLFFGGVFVVALLLLINWGFINAGARFSTEYEGTADPTVASRTFIDEPGRMGNPRPLGNWLFTYHVLPFELTSILLLAALLGAMLVARDSKAEGKSEVDEFAPVIHEEAGEEVGAMIPEVANSLILSGVLFCIGVLGVMIKRHPVIIFMCIELMLNAANLALVAFNRYHYTTAWPSLDGQVYAFMVIAIAAAEVAVGLAIIVSLFKRRSRVDVDEINLLRG